MLSPVVLNHGRGCEQTKQKLFGYELNKQASSKDQCGSAPSRGFFMRITYTYSQMSEVQLDIDNILPSLSIQFLSESLHIHFPPVVIMWSADIVIEDKIDHMDVRMGCANY